MDLVAIAHGTSLQDINSSELPTVSREVKDDKKAIKQPDKSNQHEADEECLPPVSGFRHTAWAEKYRPKLLHEMSDQKAVLDLLQKQAMSSQNVNEQTNKHA